MLFIRIAAARAGFNRAPGSLGHFSYSWRTTSGIRIWLLNAYIQLPFCRAQVDET